MVIAIFTTKNLSEWRDRLNRDDSISLSHISNIWKRREKSNSLSKSIWKDFFNSPLNIWHYCLKGISCTNIVYSFFWLSIFHTIESYIEFIHSWYKDFFFAEFITKLSHMRCLQEYNRNIMIMLELDIT